MHSEAQRIQFAAETALDMYIKTQRQWIDNIGARAPHRKSSYGERIRTTAECFERFHMRFVVILILAIFIEFYRITTVLQAIHDTHNRTERLQNFSATRGTVHVTVDKDEWMLKQACIKECEQKSGWGTGFLMENRTFTYIHFCLLMLSSHILSFVRSFSRSFRSLALLFWHMIRHYGTVHKNIFIYCVANLRKGLVHRSHWFEQFVCYRRTNAILQWYLIEKESEFESISYQEYFRGKYK